MDEKITPKWICVLEISGIALIILSIIILSFPMRDIQSDINEKEDNLSNLMLDLTLSNHDRDRAIWAYNTMEIIKNFPQTEERNECLNACKKAMETSLENQAQTLLGGLGSDTTYNLFERALINVRF